MSRSEIKLKETVCFDLNPRLAVQNIANSAIGTGDIWSVFYFWRGRISARHFNVILTSARPVKANTARLKWRADGSLAKTLP